MASRRTRLKGVINLPIRRSTVKEDVLSSNNETSQSVSVQAKQLTLPKVAQERADTTDKEIHTAIKTNICAEKPQDVHCIDISREAQDPQEAQEPEPKLSDVVIDDNASTGPNPETVPQPKLKVPLPIRKRVKPSVSLSALTRKPKDVDVENDKASKISASNICQSTALSSLEKPTDAKSLINSSSKCLDQQKDQTPFISETGASKLSTKLSTVQSPTKSCQDKNKLLSPIAICVQSPEKVVPSSKYEKSAQNRVDSLPQQSIDEEELELGNQTISGSSNTPRPNEFTNSETNGIVDKSSLHLNVASEAAPLMGKNVNATPSIASAVHEDASEIEDFQPAKIERRPHTHRRPRKSGAGETLSIARRDFFKKFGNNTPDKKKLTMFDLIFYNPTTNPMKHTNKPKLDDEKDTAESTNELVSDRIAEESVDDVTSIDEQIDIAVPAPQVKVGPDGSLIIDEKSLVIATTGSQQRKDELANSSVVVDYGLGNTTYNSFSKKVKSKEWTKEETFKFYRALQAVGTDFLLMKSIFPNRTRGDLKQKYKKEDRLNRNLVDKILRNPLEFDLTALEQELAQEEKENKKREEEKHAEKKKSRHFKQKGAVGNALLGEFSHPRNNITSVVKGQEKKTVNKNTEQRISKKRKMISDGSSSEDEECEIHLDCDFDNGKDSEERSAQNVSTLECNNNHDSDEDREGIYLLKSPQPTRYGRVPRASTLSKEATSTLQQQNDINYIMDDTENNNDDDYEMMMEEDSNFGVDSEREAISVPNNVAQPTFNISNLSNVEPGSLVILSTPGQKTLQLFMVAPKYQSSSLTHIPVAVTPEILASVNSSISDLGSQETSASADNRVENNNCNNLHPHT